MATSSELISPSAESIYKAMKGNKLSEDVRNGLLTKLERRRPTEYNIDLGRRTGKLTRRISEESGRITEELEPELKIEKELDEYKIKVLKPFFIQFPDAWYDLKRKLHANMVFAGKPRSLHIPADCEADILSVFLRLDRENDTGEIIRKNIPKEIFKNTELLTGIAQERSLLDSSHADISPIGENRQIIFLQDMMLLGLTNSAMHGDNINSAKIFKQVFSDIITYMQSIFGIRFLNEIKNIKNIPELARALQPIIWNKNNLGSGRDAKNAWMLVKAFHAWGSLSRISKKSQEANELIASIPNRLKEIGTITNIVSSSERSTKNGIEENNHMYKGTLKITLNNGKFFRCTIEYRAKSVRSILVKMWENEDYNNIDALRDTIGMAISWPDNTPEEIKLEIIQKLTNIMPQYGYMYKSKGNVLGEESQAKMKAFLKHKKNKRPLGSSTDIKAKSNPELDNVSISGFVNFPSYLSKELDSIVGSEVQFYNQSGCIWWKNDHYRYDPRKIMSAICRGDYFISPHQVLKILREEISTHVLEDILKSTSKEEFIKCVSSGFLIPYVINNNKLLFTTKDYESGFLEKFKDDKTIRKPNSNNVDTFIRNIDLS